MATHLEWWEAYRSICKKEWGMENVFTVTLYKTLIKNLKYEYEIMSQNIFPNVKYFLCIMHVNKCQLINKMCINISGI